ncbi:MAG: hypothetical protein ACYTF0_03770 [Planctomycetota bacterium]|jgi:hypothetical protein
MIRTLVMTLALVTGLCAADASADFRKAMAGNDAQAKREAIRALASSGLDSNEVIDLLIPAVSDRQASREAITALRRASGVQPAASSRRNAGYPGYPTDDSSAAWSAWFSAKRQQEQQQADLAAAQEALTAAQADIAASAQAGTQAGAEAGTEGTATSEASGGESTTSAPVISDEALYGHIDRIYFTDGSMLRCYILTKRVDLSGNITSMRVAHRKGGGEETIDATVILRFEEDIE